MAISREEALSMQDAHFEGFHDELPREGCPECERRDIYSYPTEKQLAQQRREREIAAADG